jgi:hypothetical protein
VACHACGESGRKKEKDQLQNFAKFRVEKATHRTPFLYEAMATIHMATSTSRGAYFPLPHLATSQRIHSMATIRMAALSSQGTYFMSLGLAAYPMRSKTLEKQPPQWSSIMSVIHI